VLWLAENRALARIRHHRVLRSSGRQRQLEIRFQGVIVALGDIYAQEGALDAVRELMRLTQARVKAQPGCLSYTFAETLEDPGHFVVIQEWRDRAALDEHYRSAAFADYQEQIAPRVERSSELRIHVVGESTLPVASPPVDTLQDD
jgi:quinol monooxygenase YgiN